MRREGRYCRPQRPERRNWIGKLIEQFVKSAVVVARLHKIDAMKRRKLGRQKSVITGAQDGQHAFAKQKGVFPLSAYVSGAHGLRSDDRDYALRCFDGITKLLEKSAAAALH